MKSTFLITGATGFVGSNLTRTLVNNRQRVCILTRNKALNWRLRDIASQIEIYEADILSSHLETIVNKIHPNYIFHLAAYGVLPAESDPLKMADINIKGTMNFIQALKKNPFELFINTGTSVEYGIKNKKMHESDILEPINDYGITKAAATLFCQKEGKRNNLPIITFRLFTPFGYFEDKKRLIPSAILSALKNEPINVSVPTSVRDFIFVQDIVEAYLKAIHQSFVPGEIINIGSGKQRTIKDVVTMILAITGSKSSVHWGAVKPQARFIEPKKWEADTFKLKTSLHWRPKYPLQKGLEKTVAWFQQNKELYEIN